MPQFMTLDATFPFEATAAVLAAIAWPEDFPNEKRFVDAQTALVGHLLRAVDSVDPEWAWRPQLLKPGYLLIEAGKVARSLKVTSRRIKEALIAARAARPFVAEVLTGAKPPLPRGVTRLSLNAVIPAAMDEWDETDPHNFEQRAFRRTLPVLHLALALEMAIGAAEEQAGRPPSLEELLIGDGLPAFLVNLAEPLEAAVLSIRKFKVPAKRQLQVRLKK
ncbi:hypothetical protein [Falsiroseomonas sp. E2-1-a20]|uniref:hypothetical protein n=1 Tax=Falsiroseomonas sp. E2-1-a20 TaxID=3239300 RepID=UPI003F2ADE65